jgi:spore maturation protein CgeB
MKVVIVGSRAFDSLEYHLHDSFQVLGHDVALLDVRDVLVVPSKVNYWSARFLETYDRVISQRLALKIAKLTPELVVVVYRNLHPILVDEIGKRLSEATIVQINPDALSNLEKQQIIAADFDYFFSKEPFIVDFLRNKAGLNAHYLPEAFNPRVHKKPAIEKGAAEWLTNIDVLVFGNIYAYRARMIEQLIRARIRVYVYGTKGPYMRPAVQPLFQKKYLVGPEKNRLLYGARIVFNNFHYAEVASVNQKYFEINGIGGFQLSDYKSTVDEYTSVSSDRVTFQTMDEAIDKIRYYLAHPAERREIAARQYAHFQQYHTFDRRVDGLIRTVGLYTSADSPPNHK